MKVLRLLFAVGTCAIAANLFVGTAAADPPTKSQESVVGEQIICGDTLITITEGTVAIKEHVHQHRSGLYRVIINGQTQGVRATDEEGNEFRIVGSFGGNFTTTDLDDDDAIEAGFFRIKLNIIGERGLFGTVDFREQKKRNAESTVRDRGTCQFPEDDED